MKKRAKLTVAGIVMGIALSISGAAPSSSSPALALTASQVIPKVGDQIKSAELASVKKRGDVEINKRLSSIQDMQKRITEAKYMSAAHRDTLSALLNADESGLSNLKVKLDQDIDLAAARDDVQQVFTNYRVYAIVEPKIHLVRAVDAISNSATKLDAAATRLDNAVSQLKSAGKNTSSIEPLLTSAHVSAKAAGADVGGQADAVLALQAQDYPDNKSRRDAVLTAVKKGESDAKSSLDSLNKARTQLKTLAGK